MSRAVSRAVSRGMGGWGGGGFAGILSTRTYMNIHRLRLKDCSGGGLEDGGERG